MFLRGLPISYSTQNKYLEMIHDARAIDKNNIFQLHS